MYQALVVALFGCAAAGVVLPVGRWFAPAPASKPPEVASTDKGSSKPIEPIDTTSGGQTLRALVNWDPAKAAVASVDKGEEGAGSKPAADQAPKLVSHDWAYVGSMISGASRAAIIKIDSQQHRLAEGEKLGDSTLVAIEPDWITVRTGAEEKRISLLPRTQTWPTELPKHQTPGRPGAMPGQANLPGSIPSAAATTFDARGTVPKAKPGTIVQAGGPSRTAPEPKPASMDSNRRDAIVQQLRQADLPLPSKVVALRQLGITPGMDVGSATARLREMGLDPSQDPSLGDAIRTVVGGNQ